MKLEFYQVRHKIYNLHSSQVSAGKLTVTQMDEKYDIMHYICTIKKLFKQIYLFVQFSLKLMGKKT